jgi:hypothetical protein
MISIKLESYTGPRDSVNDGMKVHTHVDKTWGCLKASVFSRPVATADGHE